MMNDENAFGILVSFYALDDDEYGLEKEEFVQRFSAFRAALRASLRDLPLGSGARGIDLGHAHYFEIEAGDQVDSPLSWARRVKGRLFDAGFATVVAVTHGSRWIDGAAESFFSTEHIGDTGFVTWSNPSEPFRRALYADAAAQRDDDGDSGWGPGVYLDTEAAEALGLSPKNSPTVLTIAGAGFYRAGK